MKRLFVCAVALGLFAAVPAVAASGDAHHGDKHQGATQGASSHSGSGGATHHITSAGAMTGVAHTRTGSAASHSALSGNSAGAMTGRAHTRTGSAASHSAMSGNSAGTMTGRAHTRTGGATSHNAISGNMAGSSGRFGNRSGHNSSIVSLRLNVQSSHHFHNGDYRAPEGYQYRHWGYGDRLPHGYYARDYWIGDFLAFGLFAPPDGLVWVRVGNDALLIDQETGEVVQVQYGVFY
jgi:Ni/Co efflux regulator RcnB